MICFNGSDLISLKANNGLLQPRLQDDDDDDDDDDMFKGAVFFRSQCICQPCMQQTITNTKSVNKLTYSKHTEQTPMLRPILTDSIWSTHFVAMTLVCLHQLRP